MKNKLGVGWGGRGIYLDLKQLAYGAAFRSTPFTCPPLPPVGPHSAHRLSWCDNRLCAAPDDQCAVHAGASTTSVTACTTQSTDQCTCRYTMCRDISRLRRVIWLQESGYSHRLFSGVEGTKQESALPPSVRWSWAAGVV